MASSVSGSARRLSADDYARAERFLPWNAKGLVYRTGVDPHWLPGDRFWYTVETPSGTERVTVDPAGGVERVPAEATPEAPAGGVRSPDGEREALVRDHNLVVRTVATGEEVAVTTDGRPDLAYGTPIPSPLAAAGLGDRSDPPPACLWAPDGAALLTYRIDAGHAGRFDWVQSVPLDGSLRPRHHTAIYPLPGDEELPSAELVVVELGTESPAPRVIGPPVPVLYYGAPLTSQRVWWSPDGARVHLVLRGRGYTSISLVEVEVATGTFRTLVEERSEVPIDPGFGRDGRPVIRVLDGGDRVLWYSQRDGWGHLYLYDASTGEVLRQLTAGEWTVLDIAGVDEERGVVAFTASGREPDRDPYEVCLYRVPLAGGEVELLTPEDGTHDITWAPGGTCFVDCCSRLDRAPVTTLRAADGRLLQTLETADISALEATGWRPPERLVAKARDGVTDIYGVLYLPTGFEGASGTRLPIVDDIYAGPQTNRAPVSFAGISDSTGQNAGFWHAQAVAELGFAVVMIDGLGMPKRSKAFWDRSYRDLADGGVPDHIAWIRRLAAGRPYLDVSRVGVYGHSAGGYASAHAILAHPDFYTVAVSSSGNHDHRLDKATWIERYMGLPVGPHYQEQANASLAANLRGKLLLIHGEMDENVHPASTLGLVDALIKANRDFDLLIMPNRPHALATDPYFVRRRWDYLVRHLLGAEPPPEYRITGPAPD